MGLSGRWPWITIAVGGVAVLSPPGWAFIESALFSSEALSRNIAQPILFVAIAVLAVLALIEWSVRWRLSRRRGDRAGTANKKTE